MPELSIVYKWHCLSDENFRTKVDGSKGKVYTVGHGRDTVIHHAQTDWHCSCPSYRHQRGTDRDGYCKHIRGVKDDPENGYCGWTQFFDGGDAVEEDGEYKCPRCNGPVTSLRWGV